MKAYVGHVGHAGLQGFVAEDMLPDDVLQDLVRGWASATTTVVLAVVSDDAAEEVYRELRADRPDAACGVLLNRAVELIPLRPTAPNPSQSKPPFGSTAPRTGSRLPPLPGRGSGVRRARVSTWR